MGRKQVRVHVQKEIRVSLKNSVKWGRGHGLTDINNNDESKYIVALIN